MDLLQLRKEIDYIFETGANGTRIFELFKMFLQRQWQPMDTAPKDGTEILICEKNGAIMVGRWLYDDWLDTSVRKDVLTPIGWQPLPKPMKV